MLTNVELVLGYADVFKKVVSKSVGDVSSVKLYRTVSVQCYGTGYLVKVSYEDRKSPGSKEA